MKSSEVTRQDRHLEHVITEQAVSATPVVYDAGNARGGFTCSLKQRTWKSKSCITMAARTAASRRRRCRRGDVDIAEILRLLRQRIGQRRDMYSAEFGDSRVALLGSVYQFFPAKVDFPQ